MSAIPTKQIDGDVAVGRNVSAGGDANVQGNARVGHDLIVEGWLEAKNIKGVNKGLFASAAALREAYPQPHDGWFAGVSASEADITALGLTVQQGKALFRMYVGSGGDWVCEPINKLYEIVVDNVQVNNLREDLSTLQGKHEALEKRVDAHDTEISGIKTQQTTLGNSINTLTNDVTTLGTRIGSAEQGIKGITDSKGKPNGIAPLDSSGKVPAAHLPGYVDDVVEFNAIVSGITPQKLSISKHSTDAGCMVVYDSEHNRFVLAVSINSVSADHATEWSDSIIRPTTTLRKPATAIEGIATQLNISDYWHITDDGIAALITSRFSYYNNWLDGDSFGVGSADGRIPEGGKVYISTSDNKTYRWSGTQLVIIGNDLAIGHTANTAFPGDEGAQLQKDMQDATAKLSTHDNRMDDIGILPFDGIWDGNGIAPRQGVIFCPNDVNGAGFRTFGGADFYGLAEEYYNSDMQGNTGRIYRCGDMLYRILDGKMSPLGGTASNFNVTVKVPLTGVGEFYSIDSKTEKFNAILTTYTKGIPEVGMQITFAVSAGKWKNYQYIGSNTDRETFCNPANWVDLAGGSSTGNIINVHEITDNWNFMSRGVAASLVPEELRKGGRKITFMASAGVYQTWQFCGVQIEDWADDTYWQPEVQGVSFNGAEAQRPDRDGIINLEYKVDVDQSLNEESSNAISNKAVVAGLKEVEDAIPQGYRFDPDLRMLIVTDGKGGEQSVVIPGGGGGGDTNPNAIELNINSAMAATIKEGDEYAIEFIWRHYNINTNVDTQYGGRAELIVGGSTVDRQEVTQGICSFNVSKWLSVGTNSIRIKITADDGVITQSAYIKLTVVTLNLTSPYLISNVTPKGTAIAFRYVVTGSGTKTVNFTLDGKPLSSETITTSGATNVKSISTGDLAHGAHRLTVQAEREISAGQILQSNVLAYDLMVLDEGNSKAIIAVELNTPEIEQYETLKIPYAVYDPANVNNAKVAISLNGHTIQTTTIDCTRKEFSYRAKEYGDLKFIFTCRDTAKEVTIKVHPAAQQIEAESDALALYLTSSGRSNDADDAGVWEYTSEAGEHTKAQFTNCNFDTQSGWLTDKSGLTALHLEKGAGCYIPYKPMATDCKLVGKTIEIEFMVSNCYDTEATVISCLSGSVGFEIKAQEAYISSALHKKVESKFKQDERIRVGFQIEQVGGNRFMYLFLNGKMSGVVQYDTSDYFVQNPAVGITLGHPSCELNVYNIRIYDNVLSFRQMVNNYIADMDDTTVMFEKLEANNILNDDASETDIDYEKAVQKIPCITFIGELPKFKGDKKKNTKVIYEDRQHPEFSFSLDQAQNDVQGTSSQYYPRKNWKFKALSPFIMSQTGASEKKYALRAVDGFGNVVPQKPVKTFCLKADFAESSGTHNTGAANFIHEVLKGAGILTPMQEIDETVRTTIYGFPILMFHQESESSPRKFIGKYNFNNDKSTHDTFGFQDIPGFNKGMVNRDDYLVYNGTLNDLQADASAYKNSEDGELMYLIENGASDPMTNHLIEYDSETATWKDKGEMWRWSAHLLTWTKRDGSTCDRAGGIMAKVEAGELVENNVECWEFLNNGHPMCLFHQSDYTSHIYGTDIPKWIDQSLCKTDENGKYAPFWAGAFEPRYPDNDDLNREYAQGKIPEQLKRVTDWLNSLGLHDANLTYEQNKAKGITFAGKVELYFNKRMMLAYDILRELMVMADQGAKNMMWAIIDGKVYIIFYDNDTIWLINNEGRLIFIPYVEPHSKDSLGKFVFNGESSVVWNAIENSPLQEEKNDLYNTMVSQGGMTYERALLWFNTRQSDQWSETVYNADSKYKYIDSFGAASEDGSGAVQNYLDIAQGSREEHRKWAMYERFQYLNSKYCTGTYRDSYVYLRANTAGESSVPSKVEVTITAAQGWYFGFRFSGNAGYSSTYIEKGDSYTFTAPAGSNPNDTETYIHQADRISDLGDLSPLYPTTLQVTQCRMLTRLVVGNKTAGYVGKLANLTLGNHPLLKYINVCNCATLQSSLDLKGCSALDEIEAQGSRITGVNLPIGSTVSKMHLPESLVQIQFERLPNLTNRNLQIDGYANVQTVDIQDCTKLNPMEIVDAVTSTTNCSLQYIRVTGVTLRGSGEELIRLIDLGVRGANDRNGKPEIYGLYEIVKLPTSEMVERIQNGILGITLILVVEAFVNTIDEVNGENYNGTAEVDTVTLDNIGDHLRYYNGESYEEYVQRTAEENRSIHDIIKE
ncbi:hypothetical protein [Muribaculum intestinale]|uniref:hypothetical protein n=1 Tax=Muribaculum intestinale TaxID=1796646 RepID=UPI0026F384FA|nr:hypothetical protein [Muribaculum intestinale]